MTKTLNTPIVVPESVRRKAGLRRGERIEFRVSGRSITIIPETSAAKEYPVRTVTRIIKEAKQTPMSRRELAALEAETATYAVKTAKKVGIKETDIAQIIHESRARRRTS
jgi:bifunctional DNA-binding transcriptional regulator/antitoxin component of YhaV-PrlF toxin-antitoxin module